jgi:hypothetical protein
LPIAKVASGDVSQGKGKERKGIAATSLYAGIGQPDFVVTNRRPEPTFSHSIPNACRVPESADRARCHRSRTRSSHPVSVSAAHGMPRIRRTTGRRRWACVRSWRGRSADRSGANRESPGVLPAFQGVRRIACIGGCLDQPCCRRSGVIEGHRGLFPIEIDRDTYNAFDLLPQILFCVCAK